MEKTEVGGGDEAEPLEVYLEEYKSLRAEILARVQTQNQTINYLLLILGAAVAAVVASLKDAGAYLPYVLFALALFLPFFTAPLSFFFFDNEIMIHALGSYLFYDRRSHIERLTNDPHVMADVLEFNHLPPRTNRLFHEISRGRWFLFVLPTLLPVAAVVIYTATNFGWLYDYTVAIPGIRVALVALCLSVFLVDVYALFLLVKVMLWLKQNKRLQTELKSVWTARQASKLQPARAPE